MLVIGPLFDARISLNNNRASSDLATGTCNRIYAVADQKISNMAGIAESYQFAT
jgi:hypothetical protein